MLRSCWQPVFCYIIYVLIKRVKHTAVEAPRLLFSTCFQVVLLLAQCSPRALLTRSPFADFRSKAPGAEAI